MDGERRPGSMDQRIFCMGLNVDATSLYLLCCALADEGSRLSRKNMLALWNGEPGALDLALEELEKLGILRKVLSDQQGHEIYRIMAPDQWNPI